MKILVSDLDGTIYRNKTVSAIDLKMINDFASRNMFVIATGRNENTFSFFSEHYDLAYQYVILCNGALIQDKNQQTIIKHSFNKEGFIYQNGKMVYLIRLKLICHMKC